MNNTIEFSHTDRSQGALMAFMVFFSTSFLGGGRPNTFQQCVLLHNTLLRASKETDIISV